MTTTRTRVTKREAEKVLAAVKRMFRSSIGAGYTPPILAKDWDWLGHGAYGWAILWEEGPYEWTYLFPGGGIEEEFGFRYAEVELPDGVWTEPITSWAIAIYPKDWA